VESNSNYRHEIHHQAICQGTRSEEPLGLGVDLYEGGCGALVKDALGGQALIFIVVVCVHAVSELFHIILTELVKDSLAG